MKYISTLLLTLLSFQSYSQEYDYSIKPAFGVESLNLGMDISKVIEVYGKQDTIITKIQEEESFMLLYGGKKWHNTAKLDYDSIYQYEIAAVAGLSPTFRIYTLDNKVVYIRFSVLQYNKVFGRRWVKRFKIEGSNTRFFTKKDKIDSVFRKPDNIYNISNNYYYYDYYLFNQKGLGLIFQDGKLFAIDVFKMRNDRP